MIKLINQTYIIKNEEEKRQKTDQIRDNKYDRINDT